MPGEINLNTLTSTKTNGRAMMAELIANSGTADLQVEMSDESADVKINDGSRVVKIDMGRDGQVRQILVNDVVVWPQ
ncbi:hypothetical protein [Halalkalirubrum salinum]|uniref:hypothetical protein n=1 Tax=Halalkalirubrum salinum TaxID=2563889 RepID=UPI0010FB722F|nr:hypothetical protein [Halalkalirubrum salinum]